MTVYDTGALEPLEFDVDVNIAGRGMEIVEAGKGTVGMSVKARIRIEALATWDSATCEAEWREVSTKIRLSPEENEEWVPLKRFEGLSRRELRGTVWAMADGDLYPESVAAAAQAGFRVPAGPSYGRAAE